MKKALHKILEHIEKDNDKRKLKHLIILTYQFVCAYKQR